VVAHRRSAAGLDEVLAFKVTVIMLLREVKLNCAVSHRNEQEVENL
jgi:hypothetical protein